MNDYWKQVVSSMSYEQLAQLDEHIKQTRRTKQNQFRSPSGAPLDPIIQDEIDRILAQFRAAIVLQGGSEMPNYTLAKLTVDHLLDLAVRNNITINVWPEKQRTHPLRT